MCLALDVDSVGAAGCPTPLLATPAAPSAYHIQEVGQRHVAQWTITNCIGVVCKDCLSELVVYLPVKLSGGRGAPAGTRD